MPLKKNTKPLVDLPGVNMDWLMGDAARLARMIEPAMTLNKHVEELTRTIELSEKKLGISALLKHVDSLERAMANNEALDRLSRFQENCSAIARRLEAATFPSSKAIESIMARTVAPFQAAVSSLEAWQGTLQARMAALETAWVLSDAPRTSMIGFAHLVRLSEATHSTEPYGQAASELLDEELGSPSEDIQYETPTERDEAAVEAGLNPELIAFQPASYSRVVWAAGFEFHLTRTPVPQPIEAADSVVVFDPTHHMVLTDVEQRLRQLVEKHLEALAGGKWVKQRVSEAVRTRWQDRQNEERGNGRPVFSLVQYADFMDLADVIGQSNNWKEAFQPIFRNPEELIISLRRLHPVRKAIAHGRPLGRADVLTLVSEATRILSALGIRMFV